MPTRPKESLLTGLKTLASNVFLWKGLAIFAAVSIFLFVLVNSFLMPMYTRHGVSVTVPDVLDQSYESAASILIRQGLRPEEIQLRKPNLPRNVVIDQNPSPESRVKPGRHVYLTVNSGDTTTVLVPKVDGFSIREARNRIMIQGLAVLNVLPDNIPSLHPNTITKQSPAAGQRVPPGAEVTLWFSTGLGDRQVLVPDITGMSIKDAQELLLGKRLRSVVIGESSAGQTIVQQSPAAGTSVREGFEIRLRVTEQ